MFAFLCQGKEEGAGGRWRVAFYWGGGVTRDRSSYVCIPNNITISGYYIPPFYDKLNSTWRFLCHSNQAYLNEICFNLILHLSSPQRLLLIYVLIILVSHQTGAEGGKHKGVVATDTHIWHFPLLLFVSLLKSLWSRVFLETDLNPLSPKADDKHLISSRNINT